LSEIIIKSNVLYVLFQGLSEYCFDIYKSDKFVTAREENRGLSRSLSKDFPDNAMAGPVILYNRISFGQAGSEIPIN